MNKKWKTGLLSLFFFLPFFGVILCASPQKAMAGTYDNAYTFYDKYGGDIVFKDGYFYFGTKGKEASASKNTTHWGTIGYRMNVQTKSKSVNIYFKLGGASVENIDEVTKNDYVYDLYRIRLSYVNKKIENSSNTAAEEFREDGGDLEVDSCMITIKFDKDGDETRSGWMEEDGDFHGSVYTSYSGIAGAASWSDPSSLHSYFNKKITYESDLKSRQIVYVRYMDKNGDYGDYDAVINRNYLYGETVSWSRAETDCYNDASISYRVTEANKSYVSVSRKKYSQKVYVKYQHADGTYDDDWILKDSDSVYYNASYSWSYGGSDGYNGASVAEYTVKDGNTHYLMISRKKYAQQVYAKYMDNTGNYSGSWVLVDNKSVYYNATYDWSYGGSDCYNGSSISQYTVKDSKTHYVYISRKQYGQTVYVKYQDSSGNYTGDWVLAASETMYYGTYYTWQYGGNDCYNVASVSQYMVVGSKVNYLYISRKQYEQKVYVKYQGSDGNYSADWILVKNENQYYGTTFTWNYDQSACYYGASVTQYVVTSSRNHYVYISRKKYTVTVVAATGISSVSGGGSYYYEAICTVDAVVKPGYTWSSWVNSYFSKDKIFSFAVRGNPVLVATAEANTYYIAFHPNGGSGSMAMMTCKYDQSYNLPAMSFSYPSKPCKYLGWNTNGESYSPSFQEGEKIHNLTTINGNVIHLYAIWDYAPELSVKDRFFTLYEAKAGVITEAELIRTVKSIDLEDGTTTIHVKNYATSTFTGCTEAKNITITYTTTDSRGNTTEKQATVTIVDTGDTDRGPMDFDGIKKYARFIDLKYYGKSYGEGGLESTSKWRTQSSFRIVLQIGMHNQKRADGSWGHVDQTWVFGKEDVKRVKEYVGQNGMGKSKRGTGISGFLSEFSSCKK